MSLVRHGSGLLCVTLVAAAASAGDFAPLVEGVHSICALSYPGPLWALNADVVPIAGSDADATPPGMPVAVAVEVGHGRVVAYGHEQLFSNDNLGIRDNRRFAGNIIDWLVGSRPRRVIATTGHQEWFGGPNLAALKADLASRGYRVSRHAGLITPEVLAKTGVLIVGNAWGTIAPEEIAAVEAFVRGGGGVLLGGLGWSWQTYAGPLTAYPMNQLGSCFGVEWIDGYVSDPTDSTQGAPILHVFYPALYPATLPQACSYIDEVTAAHPADLPAALETRAALRRRYRIAHLVLAEGSRRLSRRSEQRPGLYAFQRRLITTYPQYFRKSVVYEPGTHPTMAWVRERAYCTFVDALPLTAARRSAIGEAMGLSGRYRDLWLDCGVLLVDNAGCDNAQRQFLYRYLHGLPAGLHNLRRVCVASYLGQPDPGPVAGDLRDLEGLEAGVNLWGGRIGDGSENPFPRDVSPRRIDTFCAVTAHEVNHVVDAFAVGPQPRLRRRRDELIADAGSAPLNFLRSMFAPGFFADNPSEFFASIANQWFTDSERTLALGLMRFDAGRRDPINQALFFADVYSHGGNATTFYQIDTVGHTSRERVPLARDGRGRIVKLTANGTVYRFTLAANGDVTAYSRRAASPKAGAALCSSVTALPTRPGAEVRFVLSAPAAVGLEVLNLAGRTVRTAAGQYQAQSGPNSLLWDGRNGGGVPVPAGRYLIRLTARADDGGATTVLAPLILSR